MSSPLWNPLQVFITVMDRGKKGLTNSRRVFRTAMCYLNGSQKEVYWSWTISWTKGVMTSVCWISLPNTHIIKTSRSSTCVRICFLTENSPRPSHAMPITWWLSKTPRSIGSTELVTAIVSHTMARGVGHVSKGDRTTFWLHAIGSSSSQ